MVIYVSVCVIGYMYISKNIIDNPDMNSTPNSHVMRRGALEGDVVEYVMISSEAVMWIWMTAPVG